MRGIPSACRFSVVDGTDYGPIRQASAIRDLRREVEELKRQLRDARKEHASRGEDDEPSVSSRELKSDAGCHRHRYHARRKSAMFVRDRVATVGRVSRLDREYKSVTDAIADWRIAVCWPSIGDA